MRTVSAAGHVVHLVAELCAERDVPGLTAEQADAVRTAVERIYGVPLGLPSPKEIEDAKTRLARRLD